MHKNNFTYYVRVFGCQMNYADAERVASILNSLGGKETEDIGKDTLVVILSCGVREGAEERIINWAARTRKEHKSSIIILSGCLSHREDIQARLDKIVDAYIPINEWSNFQNNLADQIKRFNVGSDLRSEPEISRNLGSSLRLEPTSRNLLASQREFYETAPQYSTNYRAYVPIMTGCNNFCSYCVVPYARGREISRNPENILLEVKKLIKNGCKEIFLLGQNVNSYQGIDKNGRTWNFSKLVHKINDFPGRFWIKFVSSHPKDINEEFIEAFASCKKISPNLHLPIQSGSDKILQKMNRKYTRDDYLRIIKRIKSRRPELVLSSDIIVGFPGETEKDFQESLDAVEKANFEMLYTLKYSPRPETAAYKYENNVSAKAKKLRQRRLDECWKKIALEKNKRFLESTVIIIIDTVKTKITASGKKVISVHGKTFENKDVEGVANINLRDNIIGSWGTVKINSASPLGLKGKLVRVEK